MPTKEAMGRMLARMLGRTASRIAPAATPPSAAPALARLAGLRSGGVLPAAPPSAAPVGTALSGLGRGGLGGPPPAASLVIPPMPPPMPPPPAPSPSAAATTPGLLSKLHEYVRGQAHLSPGQSFRQYPISATYNAMTNPAWEAFLRPRSPRTAAVARNAYKGLLAAPLMIGAASIPDMPYRAAYEATEGLSRTARRRVARRAEAQRFPIMWHTLTGDDVIARTNRSAMRQAAWPGLVNSMDVFSRVYPRTDAVTTAARYLSPLGIMQNATRRFLPRPPRPDPRAIAAAAVAENLPEWLEAGPDVMNADYARPYREVFNGSAGDLLELASRGTPLLAPQGDADK